MLVTLSRLPIRVGRGDSDSEALTLQYRPRPGRVTRRGR